MRTHRQQGNKDFLVAVSDFAQSVERSITLVDQKRD